MHELTINSVLDVSHIVKEVLIGSRESVGRPAMPRPVEGNHMETYTMDIHTHEYRFTLSTGSKFINLVVQL